MKITEKWTKVPAQLSVASITDKQIRENTAKLMENQRRNALNEDFGMNVGAPLGANQGIPYGGDGKAVFAPIAMALVRRVFPNLFANVLVGVQPLNGPVGLAYALRFLYKDKNSDKIVEAGWKSVPKYSGYSGSTANTSGIPDAGTGVETESAEHWKVQTGSAEDFTKMPELGMMISRQAIVAKSRKLSASFSIESAEDIKRMQNVDMMTEMVKMLQYEMTAELDRETIGHCKNLCIKKVFNKSDKTPTTNDGWIGRWSQERFSGIVTQIMRYANQIRTATRRSAANIAVVSPDMATVLQSAAPFFNKIVTNVNGSAATPEVGTLNSSIKVYCDQYAVDEHMNLDNGQVLLAFKGSENNDACVIFCPYITGLVNQAIDPNDFSPRIGVMSRYAFADNMLGAENYYRLLEFKSLFASPTETSEW